MSKILIAEIDCYNVETILNKVKSDIKIGWDKGATNTGENWLLVDDDFTKLSEALNDYKEMETDLESARKDADEFEEERDKLADKVMDLESDLESEQENHANTLTRLSDLQEEFEKIKQENIQLKKVNTILKNEAKIGKLKSTN